MTDPLADAARIGAGGMLFAVIADRYLRTQALMASTLNYSITAACGLAQSATQLAISGVLLGIGMGREWASGVALGWETSPAEHRARRSA